MSADNNRYSDEEELYYLDPLDTVPPNLATLFQSEAERRLARAAINHFINNDEWHPKDIANLRRQYNRWGSNMFIWKYYRVARAYCGGYKALAAHLKLRYAV